METLELENEFQKLIDELTKLKTLSEQFEENGKLTKESVDAANLAIRNSTSLIDHTKSIFDEISNQLNNQHEKLSELRKELTHSVQQQNETSQKGFEQHLEKLDSIKDEMSSSLDSFINLNNTTIGKLGKDIENNIQNELTTNLKPIVTNLEKHTEYFQSVENKMNKQARDIEDNVQNNLTSNLKPIVTNLDKYPEYFQSLDKKMSEQTKDFDSKANGIEKLLQIFSDKTTKLFTVQLLMSVIIIVLLVLLLFHF
ncbi:MAG TPA: hypothetical protein VE912_19175 [Bacteroidales bacterium]|nr:hypothetical protein [Bacteroidales bacterium]